MSALHDFDLLLCDYVHSNIHDHLREAGFAEQLRELDPRLVDYLKTKYRTKPSPPATLPFLLSDEELHGLEDAIGAGPPLRRRLTAAQSGGAATGPSAKPHKNRTAFAASARMTVKWQASERLHRFAVMCTGEIRKQLAAAEAERWADDSMAFASQLDRAGLTLDEGIGIVREWVRETRRYLKAMGETRLLPTPQGQVPTPTSPRHVVEGESEQKIAEPPSSTTQNLKEMEHSAENPYYKRMRAAIRKLGQDAKPTTLIRHARMGKQRGYEILRDLQAHKEYMGLGSPKSARYAKEE